MEILRLAARAAERRAEQVLSQFGLTYVQFLFLQLLSEQPNCEASCGVLAYAVGSSRGTLSGLLDRLERDGWISRDRSSSEDRRLVLVSLTGNKSLAAAAAAVAAVQVPLPKPVIEALRAFIASSPHMKGRFRGTKLGLGGAANA